MPDPASTKQTTADFVKNDAIWLRVMVDGSDVASDRDSAERLWPETRDNLYDIAATLEALAAENAELRLDNDSLRTIVEETQSAYERTTAENGAEIERLSAENERLQNRIRGALRDVRCAATVLNWIDYLEGTMEAPSNPREKRHARTD